MISTATFCNKSSRQKNPFQRIGVVTVFSVDGLASGLDTAAIVESALASQQGRIDRLNVQRAEVEQEQTAFRTIEGQLLGLQGSLRNIVRSSNNAFDKKSATSSDEEAIDVSASSSATPGTYRLRVTQLAQAHQIKSNGFEDAADVVGEGAISIQVGNRALASIELEEGSTLQDLVNAVNAEVPDVQATLVDDGSSETPLRLLLTSKFSGADNAITVESTLASGAESTVDFSAPAVQDAQDAQVQIGTGAGAITVSSNDNQFDSLVAGVSLDVLKADSEKDVVVTVEEDTESVVEAIDGFIESYNQVMDFIDTNSTFNADTNSAGLLLGNRSAANVQSALRNALGTVVEGLESNLKTLTAVGIDTTDGGKLQLDRGKLEDILNGNVEGVGLADIQRLFAITGESDNPGVEFVLGTNKTQASPKGDDGKLVPYQVEITRAATAAQIDDSLAPLLENTIINDDNGMLKIELDRAEIEVKIPPGTYTRSALADQVETLINTSDDRQGRLIQTSLSAGNELILTSLSYGASSTLQVLEGTGNAQLGLTAGLTSNGEDVAGVFRVRAPGATEWTRETANGNGRTLTGDAENEYTAQLQVRSSLRQSQIGAETDANVTVTRGLGAALDAAIDRLVRTRGTAGDGGELGGVQDRYTAELESIDENIEQVEARLESRRETLVRQFAALEVTISELQSSGDALTSSLLNF